MTLRDDLEIVGGFFMSDVAINVETFLDFDGNVGFAAPEVNLATDTAVTADSVRYIADQLTLNNAVTSADWGITLSPYNETETGGVTLATADPADNSLWLDTNQLDQFVAPWLTVGNYGMPQEWCQACKVAKFDDMTSKCG